MDIDEDEKLCYYLSVKEKINIESEGRTLSRRKGEETNAVRQRVEQPPIRRVCGK